MEGGNYWKVKPLQKLRLKMKVMEIEKKKKKMQKENKSLMKITKKCSSDAFSRIKQKKKIRRVQEKNIGISVKQFSSF